MADPRLARVVTSQDPVHDAARLVCAALERIDASHGFSRLAVPGGSAAAVAATLPRLLRAEVWSRLRLTWVDERCVPASSSESNRGARERMGVFGGSAPAAVVALFENGEEPADAVSRVDAQLTEVFGGRLDVVLLGMGDDGHIASLFPGRAAPEGRVAYVSDSPKPPARRITLSGALLATALSTVLLAAGDAKRSAVERVLAGDRDMPAAALPDLTIVTDLQLDGSSA